MISPLEATGLGKRYGRKWALRDLSLRLPPGRIAGLVGPNGAGKTTFLHLATGLLRPSTGHILVFGRAPQEQPQLLLDRVGFMAQDAPLYRDFTVADILQFGRALNARWDQAGAEVRLRGLGIPFDQRVGKLSGGQRAQVALTAALGKRPELLLLDEPVASLDPLARREFLHALKGAVAEDGVNVLLSSHLVGDLERVCDYLVIVAGGQVQVAGDIDVLRSSHRLLVGPNGQENGFLSAVEVVKVVHAERQSSVLVHGGVPTLPSGWREEPLSLEELVIAYLSGAGSLPAPGVPHEVVRL